jgi:hypothetical protein
MPVIASWSYKSTVNWMWQREAQPAMKPVEWVVVR